MPRGAPRRPLRWLQRCARGAGLAVCVWLGGLLSAQPVISGITGAEFKEPTERYSHGVLGDRIEYGALEITVDHNSHSQSSLSANAVHKETRYLVRLPLDHVFEDLKPRLIDVTGDNEPEVIVVETDVAKGAQLSVYGAFGHKLAATPHIGQSNRWLAPLGAADLDGDGFVELAYIDRPHLAKTLRIWRYKDGALEPVASQTGLTNHRIGEDFISGGIRDCGAGPEIVTADANWQRIMVSTLRDGRIETREIGKYSGRDSLARATACK